MQNKEILHVILISLTESQSTLFFKLKEGEKEKTIKSDKNIVSDCNY